MLQNFEKILNKTFLGTDSAQVVCVMTMRHAVSKIYQHVCNNQSLAYCLEEGNMSLAVVNL